MFLEKQSAQKIVEDIGAIVHRNINMMDETGVIIASTDPMRIGQFHSGAKKIIDEQLKELYISEEESLENAKPGLNLPIVHNQSTVGVVGISGSYDEVIGFGQIVSKMTEILVMEQYRIEEEKLDKRVQNRFLEDWILKDSPENLEGMIERGRAIGIDITIPRQILIVSIANYEHETDSVEGQQKIEDIEHMITRELDPYPDVLVLRNTGRQIILLPSKYRKRMRSLAEHLSDVIKDRYHTGLRIGYSGRTQDVHVDYIEASRAWRGSGHTASGILCFSDMKTEIFIDDISESHKVDYLRSLFPDGSQEELESWMELIDTYFQLDGSLMKTAEALFIHKNTLQYKIHKLSELTGFDIRKPVDAAKLYMALLFYRDLQQYQTRV